MLKRLSHVSRKSLAALPAAALIALPCMAASHARHASVTTHAALGHATLAHATSSHATLTHATLTHATSTHAPSKHEASAHGARGRHPDRAERTERAAAVHHDPVPSMESDRATEIQAALIRAGYLSGQPTGVWDAESIAAMQKLQDENGWQTKFTPDSRALVKLGLGAAPMQSALAIEETQSVSPAQP